MKTERRSKRSLVPFWLWFIFYVACAVQCVRDWQETHPVNTVETSWTDDSSSHVSEELIIIAVTTCAFFTANRLQLRFVHCLGWAACVWFVSSYAALPVISHLGIQQRSYANPYWILRVIVFRYAFCITALMALWYLAFARDRSDEKPKSQDSTEPSTPIQFSIENERQDHRGCLRQLV